MIADGLGGVSTGEDGRQVIIYVLWKQIQIARRPPATA
jgi:hypothetical protein